MLRVLAPPSSQAEPCQGVLPPTPHFTPFQWSFATIAFAALRSSLGSIHQRVGFEDRGESDRQTAGDPIEISCYRRGLVQGTRPEISVFFCPGTETRARDPWLVRDIDTVY